MLERLEETTQRLQSFPKRGSYPAELLEFGIREYRQAFFKPHRIVDRVMAQQVLAYLIADGRRNLQTLLGQRLLE